MSFFHVASEIGIKQDSPNLNLDLDSLIDCTFITQSKSGFNVNLNPDLIIEYLLRRQKSRLETRRVLRLHCCKDVTCFQYDAGFTFSGLNLLL